MAFDTVIFDGKTLSDMFADVYKNTEAKRGQVNGFVSNLVKLIRTPEDAAMLGPVVKEFLDVQVKSDEHIVRLVQIAQRLVTVNNKPGESGLLTDEEKKQLLQNVKDDFEAVLTEQEALQDTLDTVAHKL